jgi:hypothetical protein
LEGIRENFDFDGIKSTSIHVNPQETEQGLRRETDHDLALIISYGRYFFMSK